jgi:hypothetical protein
LAVKLNLNAAEYVEAVYESIADRVAAMQNVRCRTSSFRIVDCTGECRAHFSIVMTLVSYSSDKCFSGVAGPHSSDIELTRG